MKNEKLNIIASMIDLMHSFADTNPTTLGQETADQIKETIGLIANPKCQGTVLYTAVLPIRQSIGNAIAVDHYQLTPQQADAWAHFKEQTQHAYDDYWKSISILRTL